ncbi:hypothetical protein [Bradyrhizobium sp. URHC0002]
MWRISISEESLDNFAKYFPPHYSTDVDSIMHGTELPAASINDDVVKEWQKDFRERKIKYGMLEFFQTTLQLRPACSFWRLAMRSIFDESEMIVEVPRPANFLNDFEALLRQEN